MKRKIIYKSFDEDIITNQGQNIVLPKDYSWLDDTLKKKVLSACAYKFAGVFSIIYSKLYLHIKVIGKDCFQEKGNRGFYVYGNHTQMIGDAFVPRILFKGCRMRAIVSTANLGLPVLGKILPYIGALPIPEFARMKKFVEGIEHYTDMGNGIVIYPEAHVWPYYTNIRPFGTVAFSYPVKSKLPVYCMTTTYQKPMLGKKPKITIYIDGPFEPDRTKSIVQQKKELNEKVFKCMELRSRNSNYEYWEYEEQV